MQTRTCLAAGAGEDPCRGREDSSAPSSTHVTRDLRALDLRTTQHPAPATAIVVPRRLASLRDRRRDDGAPRHALPAGPPPRPGAAPPRIEPVPSGAKD